jgi:hypothetical protein
LEPDPLSLLQVCCPKHAETALLPYAQNEFDFGYWPAFYPKKMTRFLKTRIADRRGVIGSVSLAYSGWSFEEVPKFLRAMDALPKLHTLKICNFY